MLNTVVAGSQAAARGSSQDMALAHGSAQAPLVGLDSSPDSHDSATVTSLLGDGMSLSECCGLLSLCIAMIMGVGALALALLRRTGRGRVLWQVPPPHTFTLGRTLAPHYSMSPLQRTAVLRL